MKRPSASIPDFADDAPGKNHIVFDFIPPSVNGALNSEWLLPLYHRQWLIKIDEKRTHQKLG